MITIIEGGLANHYTLKKDDNWLMAIQINGELPVEKQRELLKEMVKNIPE